MDFWRAEQLLEIHKEKTEEEARHRKKQEKEQNASMPDMGGMFNQQQNAFKGMMSGGQSPFKR